MRTAATSRTWIETTLTSVREAVTGPRAAGVMLVLAALTVVVVGLSTPVSRDEHLYLAAAALAGDLRPGADFAILQGPLSTWYHAAVLAVWPGAEVLLPARLAQIVVAWLVGLVLWAVMRRLGASRLLAAALLLLLVHTEVVRESLGVARNYEPAILLSLLPWLLLPLEPGDPEHRWRLVAAGALATLAVGLKLTHAATAVVTILWPAVAPTTTTGGRRDVLWTLLGAGLAAGLALLVLLGTDAELVRFGLVDYHLANARFHEAAGLGGGMTVAGKFDDAARLIRRTDLAAWSVLVVIALGLAAASGRGRPVVRWRVGAVLLAAGAVMVAVPRPVQTSYYATLLLGGVLVVAATPAWLGARARRARRSLVALALVATAIAVVHISGRDVRAASVALRPDAWPARIVHDAGRRLDRAIGERRGRVLTTHPLYALEAGRPLDPAMATGVFVWRLGDHLDRRLAADPRLLVPARLGAHLAVRPPVAIVVEAAAPWDAPLSRWARAREWRMHPLAGGTVAWIPPADGSTDRMEGDRPR
ncbi:hypothetical protein GF314_05435 [bacterium]|nr:hypothetical protein [bacterium]